MKNQKTPSRSLQFKNKIILLSLMFLIIAGNANSQSSIDGVYATTIENSKITLTIYEKNFEIYTKYQYFKNKKKNQPTVQKIFRGYRNEDGYIYFTQPHESLLMLNIDDKFTYKHFRVKTLSYYDKIAPEPPNTIVKKPNIEEAPNQTLYREQQSQDLLREFKNEIEPLKQKMYPQYGQPIRKITDELKYYSHFGKDWIIYQHDGRHGKLLVDPDNIYEKINLRVYILPQEEYPIKDVKMFIENWLINSKSLLKTCYPKITRIEFYKALNSDVGLFDFTPERHIVTAAKVEGSNNFSISISDIAKQEITSIDKGNLNRFNEIKKYKDQYWALPMLNQLKYELKYFYISETNFYKELNQMIDSLGIEMTSILLDKAYQDLSKVSPTDKNGLIAWYETYTEAFLNFSNPNDSNLNDNTVLEVERLYWEKCEKYWENNITHIKSEVLKCQTASELEFTKSKFEFLFAISRLYDKNGYYSNFMNSCNEKLNIWKIEQEEKNKAIEKEWQQKIQERQRRIDSGELCECCNNERLVCERCKGQGHKLGVNWKGKIDYVYCCIGGTIRCHCCGKSY